jgi:hypothetical protein
MAQHGLTEPAMNYYTKESQRGLSSSLGTVLQAGGNVNNIADLYDAYNQGEGKIAAEDSQLKDDHIKNLIEANANLANERDKQWTLNEYEPYKDKIKSANQQMASADAMISGGMNDAASVGAAYAGSQTYENKPMQTMGEAKGVEDLPLASSAGSPNINYTPRTDVSQKDLFSTQGGSDALAQMMASNPNSPYVRNLLDAVNKSGVK